MEFVADVETGGCPSGVSAHDRNRCPSVVRSISTAESGTAESDPDLESGGTGRTPF